MFNHFLMKMKKCFKNNARLLNGKKYYSPSVIGRDVTIVGDIVCSGEIIIFGELVGSIACERLHIHQEAIINGVMKVKIKNYL